MQPWRLFTRRPSRRSPANVLCASARKAATDRGVAKQTCGILGSIEKNTNRQAALRAKTHRRRGPSQKPGSRTGPGQGCPLPLNQALISSIQDHRRPSLPCAPARQLSTSWGKIFCHDLIAIPTDLLERLEPLITSVVQPLITSVVHLLRLDSIQSHKASEPHGL